MVCFYQIFVFATQANPSERTVAVVKDGSNVMADMAVQCFAGNCARGMSLVALHNGGGVGIGKAINGGFGMVCDGSERVDEILRSAMLWDGSGKAPMDVRIQ